MIRLYNKLKTLLNWKPTRDPIIVRYLSDRIEKWEKAQKCYIFYPKHANFNQLIVYEHPMTSFIPIVFANKWEFIVKTVIIPPEKMHNKDRKLYRELKGYECELDMRGIISKKPMFQPLRLNLDLSDKIPEIKVSNKLARLLQQNKALKALLRKVRPDFLYVLLESGTAKISFLSDRSIEGTLKYLNNPREISWAVGFIKGPIDSFMLTKSNITRFYDLMDTISGLLRIFTSEVAKRTPGKYR